MSAPFFLSSFFFLSFKPSLSLASIPGSVFTLPRQWKRCIAFLRAPRGISAHSHPHTRMHIRTCRPTKRFKGPYSLASTQDGINTQPSLQNAPTAFLRAPRPIPSYARTYVYRTYRTNAAMHSPITHETLGHEIRRHQSTCLQASHCNGMCPSSSST